MNRDAILHRPVITEKATGLAEKSNTVAFEVASAANKYQIRDAVQAIYGVKVIKVRTAISHGKLKRRGSSVGRRPNTKKALVTLKKGDAIDFYATE
jgi:large subunit ribosomal protein L23